MKLPPWLRLGRGSTPVAKEALGVSTVPGVTSTDVLVGPQHGRGWGGRILESFAGAWQRNIVVDNIHDVTTNSGVFACISLITNDISKLRPMQMKLMPDGTSKEVDYFAAHERVLIKPNSYQTRIQFYSAWMTSKLLYGNVYVLKRRDARDVVDELHVLDPRLVKPLVTADGDVYYQLGRDNLAQTSLETAIAVPASEIIHDRGVCLWHPLVGVSPIYACGASATQGNRIIANSTNFFANQSRPSGMLTAPDVIDDITAQRLLATFNSAFSGANVGKLFVAGDGIEYKPLTISATDAQLITQLAWTIEDAARCFLVPLYKLGVGEPPRGATIEQLNDMYYSTTLQIHLEAIETLLDEGLALPKGFRVQFDLDSLLRMDEKGLSEVLSSDVKAGIMSPNEARRRKNLPPVKGGELPLMQQQNFSLQELADRQAAGIKPQPIAGAGTAPAVTPPATDPPASTNEPAPAEPTKSIDAIAKRMDEQLEASRAESERRAADLVAMRELVAEAQRAADAQREEAQAAATAAAAALAETERQQDAERETNEMLAAIAAGLTEESVCG